MGVLFYRPSPSITVHAQGAGYTKLRTLFVLRADSRVVLMTSIAAEACSEADRLAARNH